MKRLLLTCAAMLSFASVAVLPTSCSVVRDARAALETMPQEEYLVLVEQVRENSVRLGRLGQQHLDFEIRLKVIDISNKAMHIVNDDGVTAVDVGAWVMEYFDESVLPEDALEMLRDGLRFVDVAVGQIRLGIDGKITFREKQLILTVMAGISAGLVG
jgi:hypothetical protein